MTRKIEAGTVIASGTWNGLSLVEAFSKALDELCGMNQTHYRIVYKAQDFLVLHGPDSEVPELLTELREALDEYSPEDMYFGTQDGYVGSDFGWWYAQ
jgi:hypothetical protein